MKLQPVFDLCQHALFDVPSTDILFNPYHTTHATLDQPGAAQTRRDNLRNCLACYAERPPLFLLAEAPGPWGCRFSGVPLVSESQLVDDGFPIDGTPTSRADEPHREYSASIYWRVLQPHFPHFFTWNSVPFHPHDADDPLTIRTPRRNEVARYEDLLIDLLGLLKPERVVAIGRKAERALSEIETDCTYVRHPSQGGAKKFESGMQDILVAHGLTPVSEL